MNQSDRWRLKTARTRVQLMENRTDWFRIEARAEEDDTVAVFIYDEIGFWGVTAQDFVTAIGAITAPKMIVHLNSPGGEVFDGIAIYNGLVDWPGHVTVQVDALAASAASVIAMAGDEIVMNTGSEMMIHNARGVCIGSAADMEKMATVLANQNEKLAAIYAARAGGDTGDWLALMAAETWFSASEAVEAGLADRLIAIDDTDDPPDETTNRTWDLSTVFSHTCRDDAGPPPAVAKSAPEPLNDAGPSDDEAADNPFAALATWNGRGQ